MIYFDNAATGGFKPNAVIESANTTIRYLLANPGRSSHRLSLTGMQTVVNARTVFSEYFSCPFERVVFTKNCTESLNLAIFGTLKVGGHVITTVFEHNSVLRPLNALHEKGLITLDIVQPDLNKSIVDTIKEKICDKTYLLVCNSVSNVNGQVLPIKEIGELAKNHSLIFLVDGAQGGGHIDLNLEKNNISILCLAGHKGLYGIMTSGVLLFGEKVEIDPLIFGGTGSETFNLNQPLDYPERLESGTLNLPAIASLFEGMNYVKSNRENFASHLLSMSEKMINGLKQIEKVKIYSNPNECGIVAFSLENLPSGKVADILNSDYDIAVRGGFHCAPLMHKFLNTEKDGLVRASLAVQNSSREVAFFLQAVSQIAKRNE